MRDVLVVGAGLAGFRTVEELRGRGFAGRIVLAGAELRAPYDRPPLSKKVLIDADPPDPALRADFAALDVEFRPGEEVAGLGDDITVIATGAAPIALPGSGRQRFLRTYDDALALRGLLRKGLRLAIVGAGWIGAELATAAALRGCEVTVVEAGPAPLASVLGVGLGALTAPWYAEAGVDLRTGAPVSEVQDGGLKMADGQELAADEVVTAIGVRPCTQWLKGTDIQLDNGVAVDGGLRTSVKGVFAVGDVAAFESARFGRRLRFEHWDVALHAPEVVAANILGADAIYDPVPYFWSEQFGRMVQYAGYHGDAKALVWRGDPQDPQWTVCWLDAQDRLAALLAVGRPRDLVQGRRLIAAAAPVDLARLADPAVQVKDAGY